MTKEQNQGVEAVTTLARGYAVLSARVDVYRSIRNADRVVLRRVFNDQTTMVTRIPFEVLMSVMVLKGANKHCIRQDLNMDGRVVNKGLVYLQGLGYIMAVASPRVIKVFNKYKVDTGYVITDKGCEALCAIILGE